MVNLYYECVSYSSNGVYDRGIIRFDCCYNVLRFWGCRFHSCNRKQKRHRSIVAILGLMGAHGHRRILCTKITKSQNRRLGVKNGAKRRPPPGIQAQRPRTRTARTTRQINGAILFGG